MPLLDVVMGYDCNLKCTYCTITDAMRRRHLDARVICGEIDGAARRGWDRIAFTGGEPTIFPELPALVGRAKERGFREIKVQSNGLRYAHAPYLDHLIARGANLFHVSLHAFDDAEYERTVQRADVARLRRAGLANLIERRLDVVADLIIEKRTLGYVPEWIRSLVAVGVRRFALWLVSLTDQNSGRVETLPKLEEVAPALVAAFDDARAGGYEVVSLHVPKCFLPGYEDHVRHPGADGVRVITPDDRFDLEESRLTGGVKPATCRECCFFETCPGLRADYVAVFGTSEVESRAVRSKAVAEDRVE